MCQQHAGSGKEKPRAGHWPWESRTSPRLAGGGWGSASDLYLIYFIGLFRARHLPLGVSACSTFMGLGGKNSEYSRIFFSVCGRVPTRKGRRTHLLLLHCFAVRQAFKAGSACITRLEEFAGLWPLRAALPSLVPSSQPVPRCWISPCCCGLLWGWEGSLLLRCPVNVTPRVAHDQGNYGLCWLPADLGMRRAELCPREGVTWVVLPAEISTRPPCVGSAPTAGAEKGEEVPLHTTWFSFPFLPQKTTRQDWELLPLH